MNANYRQKIKKQIKKLELFPDKLYFLEAIRTIILEIKTSKGVFKTKKGNSYNFCKKKVN
jgi:hypothetical protein